MSLVKMFLLIILRTVYHRAFIFHMLIGIVFVFFRSRCQDYNRHFKKMFSAYCLENNFSQSLYICM